MTRVTAGRRPYRKLVVIFEPLRLTVVIDGRAAAIQRVIARHAVVRRLLDNGRLHLWRFAGEGAFSRYAPGCWAPVAA